MIGLGFRVWGLGFRVEGLEFRVEGLGVSQNNPIGGFMGYCPKNGESNGKDGT